ncbi:hypothetical protein RM844_06070 [Streptomyces sp. DSM 44915]|uniref:Uncharacterized protein n=1 Tax=Streptomyces chisholmiae TaxID=3075540 RepID=A0ABU2JMA5_9ACTN|nr:hypothetical protein [Streptomyces sp. DSM 44915]MDT0265854.1 hypothetical protein [Streptomyces sp. DSM 44915]
MRRISDAELRGKRQEYLAQILVSDEEVQRLGGGPPDRVVDGLGARLSTPVRLETGVIAVLARHEVHPPVPGYIMTAVSELPGEEIVEQFLRESGLPASAVLRPTAD